MAQATAESVESAATALTPAPPQQSSAGAASAQNLISQRLTAERAELDLGARRQQLAAERAEFEATVRRVRRQQADLEARESRVAELSMLEARRVSKAKEAMDAATRRLRDERARFQRQQAEELALPVVTAVAVAQTVIAATDQGGAPLRAVEFERDEGFRVLRCFLRSFHIEQHARLLQEACGWVAALPHCAAHAIVLGSPSFFLRD